MTLSVLDTPPLPSLLAVASLEIPATWGAGVPSGSQMPLCAWLSGLQPLSLDILGVGSGDLDPHPWARVTLPLSVAALLWERISTSIHCFICSEYIYCLPCAIQ